MMVLTGTVGEEFIIDGRIRIRILAIEGEEVRLEVNFPEFLRPDGDEVHGKPHRTESLAGWFEREVGHVSNMLHGLGLAHR